MPEEEKVKKPIYKKWWFWLIIIVVIIGIAGCSTNTTNTINTSSNNIYTKNTSSSDTEVTIIDFSTISREEVKVWFNNNKINGTINEEYSDTVVKGAFISQSIAANTIAHEGDKITVTYSLGKKPTVGQKNALKKAESYSATMHMSKRGIYKQLTSEYGEGFTAEEAQYAIDNMNADWNANALAKAKSYQESMSMSKSAIYKQLISEYGEEFTAKEAQYAIDHLED